MKKYLVKKIILPLQSYLKQGISPSKLALCMALGSVFGIIPMLGVTTLLCVFVSFIFRLNMGVIQIVNYAVYPLQIIFFIPFINSGIYIFNADPLPFSTDQITLMLKENVIDLLMTLGYFNLLGIAVWVMLAPFMGVLIYYFSHWTFKRYKLSNQNTADN